jgi:hypothetical protein
MWEPILLEEMLGLTRLDAEKCSDSFCAVEHLAVSECIVRNDHLYVLLLVLNASD